MSQIDTLAVLRDAFVMGLLALSLGLLVHGLLRLLTDSPWNVEGNVLTRPYGVPDAVVSLLLLVLFGSVFFAEVAAADAGAGSADAADALTFSSLVMQTVSMLLMCVILLGYLSVVRGLNPAEMFGIRLMSMRRALLYAVPALILTVLGISAVMALFAMWTGGKLPDTSAQETVLAFEKSGSPAFRAMLTIMAVITAPLTEEFIFRGFLYGVVKRYTERWFAAVFTSLVFAVVHFHVGTAPQLFLLGLGLAIAYEQTGCLLVPLFMHALFNAWNVAVLTLLAQPT